MATDEVRSYAVFNYLHMGWTTHTEAGGDGNEGQGGIPAYVSQQGYLSAPEERTILSAGKQIHFYSLKIISKVSPNTNSTVPQCLN